MPSSHIAALIALSASLLLACGAGTSVRDASDGDTEVVSTTRSVPLPEDASWGAVAVDRDTVYLIGVTSDPNLQYSSLERYLLAIDASTGETLFRSTFQLPATAVNTYSVELITSEHAVIFRTEQSLSALDPEDGSLLWEHENTQYSIHRAVGVSDDTLFTYTPPNLVYGYDLRSGDRQSFEFNGYQNLMQAWLSSDGARVIGVANPITPTGEMVAVAMSLDTGAAPIEIARVPEDGSSCFVGPLVNNLSGNAIYDRSDHVIAFHQTYERVNLRSWSTDEATEQPEWEHAIAFDPNTYYNIGCHNPSLHLNGSLVLVERPNSQGLLLSNVLRLQLFDLGAESLRWTGILPTNHVVDAAYRVHPDHIVIHTRPESSDSSDRWHLFDLRSGQRLWSSEGALHSNISTLWFDVSPRHLVRLTTTNGIHGTLVIDTLDLD